ncbi:MAG: hypothetical protein SFU85_00380 [Candidatus Methylacidiphilales bacterium]|nr:hypothetical protein [Candidatus Methylacidiphilales bacterium]
MDPPRSAPPVSQLLEQAISIRERRFNPEVGFISAKGGGPGYHTRTTKDQTVHHIHDTAQYAQLLLMRGRPEDVTRASEILSKLVDLQVTDPGSKFYGLWGWFVEEPPEKMAPADWNWADFIGARLAEILKNHAAPLDPALVVRLRESLRHASNCIIKRNIGPGYTNICAMGAAVTLAAGEILDEPSFVDYGRRRISAQRVSFERNGGVPEYNSPDYGVVLIQELERILRLVEDPAARADAEWMRQKAWILTAEQFHPGTGQWAGAQSRAYSGQLRGSLALYLWLRSGVPPRGVETMPFNAFPDLLDNRTEFACPPEAVMRFARLPADPHEVRQVWMLPRGSIPEVALTSWFTANACLGSINEETTWVQHRPITAFWATDSGNTASFRVNLLKDGKEFASGRLRIRQSGPRLLAVLGLAMGQGDWHVSLDRPKDGVFRASDLRLRCLLESPGAQVESLPSGTWTLGTGSHRMAIHPGEVLFDGQPGRWASGSDAKGAFVDAILHTGSPVSFKPEALGETTAAFGLEMLTAAESPSPQPISCQALETHRSWRWQPVPGDVQAPRHLAPLP